MLFLKQLIMIIIYNRILGLLQAIDYLWRSFYFNVGSLIHILKLLMIRENDVTESSYLLILDAHR